MAQVTGMTASEIVEELNTSLVSGHIDPATAHLLLTRRDGGVLDAGAAGVGSQGPVGPQGPKGDTGATGAQGPQGLKGDTGAPGMVWKGPWSYFAGYNVGDSVSYNGASYVNSVAINGTTTGNNPSVDTTHWNLLADKGGKGDIGNTGPQGPIGNTGPQGPIGNTGPQGPIGNTGPQGPVGPQGLVWKGAWSYFAGYNVGDAVSYNGASYVNIVAINGTTTLNNPSVDTGHWTLLVDRGAKGDKGDTGPQGSTGPQGPQGPKGDTGAQGPQGIQGPAGTAGTPIDSWPIGSLFMAVVPTNPAVLLGGGTWVSWGTGRMPVGVDTTQTEFDAVEETGGAKTHTLTELEIPSHYHSTPNHAHDISHDHPNTTTSTNGNHNHTIYIEWSATTTSGGTTIRVTDIMNFTGGTGTSGEAPTRDAGNHAHTLDVPPYSGSTDTSGGGSTGSTGGGKPHNNLPPYITCYMWKRTA